MANGTASTNGTWPIKNPTPDIDWNLVSKSQRTREACLFLFNFLRFHFDCLFCFSSFRNFARDIPLISKKMWNALPFCLRAVHETGGDGISMLADDLDIPELIMANLEPSEMRPLRCVSIIFDLEMRIQNLLFLCGHTDHLIRKIR